MLREAHMLPFHRVVDYARAFGLGVGVRWIKGLILLGVTVVVAAVSLVFAVLYHEDGDNRVTFRLTDHEGRYVTQEDFLGKHLVVFFGFTNCSRICPVQMSKLTKVMMALDETGHGGRVTPVFVSVDPERDGPDEVAAYLTHFHERFVGLTGSRTALASTADAFKTLLDAPPTDAEPGYQLTHSSVVYVVDPFSRIIDYIPFAEGHEAMTGRIRALL